jgi:hypothetical protein
MLVRRLPAAAAVIGLIALAAPIAGASADTTATPSPLLTFVPPTVGSLTVSLGATIINGQVISPGLYVSTPGISLPPITWTPPAGLTLPPGALTLP